MTENGNNDADNSEWTIGDAAMAKLEAVATPTGGIPYGFTPGNHDLTGGLTRYDTWFGESRFTGRPYYGGHDDSDNRNSYDVFSASGMSFIVLNIDCSATPATGPLDWADGLLKADVNRRGIVVCHDLLTSSNVFSGAGTAVYNALRDNPNLFLMLGGHLDTEGQLTGSNTANGGAIYALRSDYQTRPNGGDSWMRLMEFQPSNNRIQVRTFAPCLNSGAGTYEQDADSEFTLSYNMAGSSAYDMIGTPQSASSGSTAAVNWPSLTQGTQYEWYVTVSDGNTTVTGPTWSFTTGTGGNHPPTVTQPSDQTSAEGQVISLQVVASDQDGDTLNYLATNLPPGLTIGAGTGLIAGTISAGASSGSPYNVTVTVLDGKLGSTSTSFTWTVQPTVLRPCGSDPTLVGCWLMDEGSGTTAADGGSAPGQHCHLRGHTDLDQRPKWRGDQPQRHEPVRRHAGRGQPGHRQPDHPGGLGQARDHLRHAARPN